MQPCDPSGRHAGTLQRIKPTTKHKKQLNMKKTRRALVSLPEGVWKVIDEELKGKIGNGDSEVIRNVVLSYLTERGYILKPKKEDVSTNQIAGEVDVHDSMITSQVEMLEEKGQLKYSEWENKVKRKLILLASGRTE
jgi:hypothetical protein